MDLTEYAQKYKEKNSDVRTLFTMPIGWGWAFPLIKYVSIGLLAIKTYTAIPWFPFFILAGITIRVLMIPLLIKQMILIHRMAKVLLITLTIYLDYS